MSGATLTSHACAGCVHGYVSHAATALKHCAAAGNRAWGPRGRPLLLRLHAALARPGGVLRTVVCTECSCPHTIMHTTDDSMCICCACWLLLPKPAKTLLDTAPPAKLPFCCDYDRAALPPTTHEPRDTPPHSLLTSSSTFSTFSSVSSSRSVAAEATCTPADTYINS